MSLQNENFLVQINWLRSFAVISVIAYHANIPGFNGGFIGVDIFIVISGYLITKNFLGQNIEVKNPASCFLLSRIRRIYPALIFTQLLSLVAAYYLLFPKEITEFNQSLFSSILSVSNIYFNTRLGYFNFDTNIKPLIHTWSLSLEIQFYIFLASFFTVVKKLKLKNNLAILIFVSSLVLCVTFGSIHTRFNFYELPTRLWEFFIGGLPILFPNCVERIKNYYLRWTEPIVTL
jgi:peptidoglycan/LPS O-acetylase OafA/YrhL